jgi:uncharacterized phage-like protein YoqJ
MIVSERPFDVETIVPQQLQPVTEKRETVIVTAKGEDVSQWRKYANIYYKRSLTSADETTRNRNRETYEHYKNLLETVGYKITEGTATITIHDKEAAA